MLIKFKAATERTKNIFNPWGDLPRDAILEAKVNPKGYASVDLTIFKTATEYYAFAHGSVLENERYDTLRQACKGARAWYENNRHRFVNSQYQP